MHDWSQFEPILRRPLTIGHRGVVREAPENSLAGFERAFQEGLDGIEFDVRRTADGVPVVLHDATLDRTTTGAGPVAAVRSPEVAALELRGAPAGMHRVPTLAEALARFGPRGHLHVEVKTDRDASGAEAFGHEVGTVLRSATLAVPALGMSFDPAALRGLRAAAPGLDLALLLFDARDLGPTRAREEIVGQAREVDAAFIGLPDTSVAPEIVAYFHRWSFQVVTWVNVDDAAIRRGVQSHVDRMETDDPRRLLQRLSVLPRRRTATTN
ncbi:MAG: glycerophosphodiester phosphodiesterase [Actinobacteria bacterium]|nr:glycerophosphodiester phosphodiesterase [Actinomycetota bacterium]